MPEFKKLPAREEIAPMERAIVARGRTVVVPRTFSVRSSRDKQYGKPSVDSIADTGEADRLCRDHRRFYRPLWAPGLRPLRQRCSLAGRSCAAFSGGGEREGTLSARFPRMSGCARLYPPLDNALARASSTFTIR